MRDHSTTPETLPRRCLALILGLICCTLGADRATAQPPDRLPDAKIQAGSPPLVSAAALHFTEDGNRLVVLRHFTSKNEPLLTVQDVATGKQLYNPLVGSDLFGPAELVRDRFGKASPDFRRYGITATLSPDGQRFVTCSYHTLRLWNLATGKPISPPLEFPGSVKATFSKDGKRLLVANMTSVKMRRVKATCQFRFLDPASGAVVAEFAPTAAPNENAINDILKSLVLSPDGKMFVLANSSWLRDAETFQLWDAVAMKPIGTPPLVPGDFHRFDDDGKKLLVVSRKEAALWDTAERKTVANLITPDVTAKWMQTQERPLSGLPWFGAVSGKAEILYSHRDRTQLWSLDGPMPRKVSSIDHTEGVQFIALSRDGTHLAVAHNGRSEGVVLWNLKTGKATLNIPVAQASYRDKWGDHNGGAKAMEFSPDGRLLAVVDGMGVRIWKAE